MKQILFICTLVCTTMLNAQTDSLCKVYQKHILKIEQALKSVKSENKVLGQNVMILKERINKQNFVLDSLKSVMTLNA